MNKFSFPKIEFCCNCKVFEAGKLRDKKFYCLTCLDDSVGVINIPPPESYSKPTQKRKKYSSTNISEFINQDFQKNKRKEKTIRDLILEEMQKNPFKIYRVSDFYDSILNTRCKNRSSIINAIRQLIIDGKIYGRDIYIRGHKSGKLVSMNEYVLENHEDIKSSSRIIYDAIKNKAPIDTKKLCELLQCSSQNVVTRIKKDLIDIVDIWKYQYKFFYTLKKDKEAKKIMMTKYENAQIINR